MLSARPIVATLVATIVLFAGPAGADGHVPLSVDNPPPLEPGAVAGYYVWQKPGFSWKKYDRIMIDLPEFMIHPASPEKGIKPERLHLSGQAMRSHVVNAMEPTYPVVNKPGPKVLLIRPALTNVMLKKEDRVVGGVLGFMPAAMATNTIQEAAGRSLEFKDAKFEAEFLDSLSGERVMVMVDTEIRERLGAKPTWEALTGVFDQHARTLRQRFDEAHKQ